MIPQLFNFFGACIRIIHQAIQISVLIQPFGIILCLEISLVLYPLIKRRTGERHRLLEKHFVGIDFLGKAEGVFNGAQIIAFESNHKATEHFDPQFFGILRKS